MEIFIVFVPIALITIAVCCYFNYRANQQIELGYTNLNAAREKCIELEALIYNHNKTHNHE